MAGGVGRIQHALMRQVMRTELIRVKALIGRRRCSR